MQKFPSRWKQFTPLISAECQYNIVRFPDYFIWITLHALHQFLTVHTQCAHTLKFSVKIERAFVCIHNCMFQLFFEYTKNDRFTVNDRLERLDYDVFNCCCVAGCSKAVNIRFYVSDICEMFCLFVFVVAWTSLVLNKSCKYLCACLLEDAL